ncbi:hypothetical protein F5148DRAFT_1182386, partial [Russula earlei]
MVNFHDPSVVLKDYIALIKLNHALAGIYIWETVFTAGFELDVLRRKRPYRWTIWVSSLRIQNTIRLLNDESSYISALATLACLRSSFSSSTLTVPVFLV